MKRSTFLTLASTIALTIGAFSLLAPALLLDSKGVSSKLALIWTREVGVLLFAIGLILFMVREHEDSSTLRAVMIGSTVIQIGLLPIEMIAYREGLITRISGIIPNTIVHIFLASGFCYYILKMPSVKVPLKSKL